MDEFDRAIINHLQGGFPISERPFAEAAQSLGIAEQTLIERIERLVADNVLSRFGPLYRAERMGGAVTLAAMEVPAAELERVAEQVNSFPEVAHNYAREHALNLWFVIAVETPERIAEVIEAIEARTGYTVHNMPKLEEYCLEAIFRA